MAQHRDGPETSQMSSPEVDLGMAAELARLVEENVQLRQKLTEMASSMSRLKRDVLEASEPELVTLATAIAERVIGRELQIDPTLVVSWAQEALAVLASKGEVVIALGRDVAQSVPSDAWSAVEGNHRLCTDPALPPGAVEVRAAEGELAAGAEARLAAVAQALGAADP